jgi:hypothetical protein
MEFKFPDGKPNERHNPQSLTHQRRIVIFFIRCQARKVSVTASSVFSMTSSVCRMERNPASNCDGAR